MTLHPVSNFARRFPTFIVSIVSLSVGASCALPGDGDQPATSEITQGVMSVVNESVIEGAQITSGGEIYTHNVSLAVGGWCEFETTLGTMPDTVISLQNAARQQIDIDDDSGPGYGSRLIKNLPAGTYYVEVRGFGPTQFGSWELRVSCGTDPVLFHQSFTPNGDPGQCYGKLGLQNAIMGTWTQGIVIDADDRSGWCDQSFGVTDPLGVVPGLSLNVNFVASGDAGQCINPGFRSIPLSTANDPTLSSSYGINTDSRSGGCWQTFSFGASSTSTVGLEVEFLANGDGQCGNTGTYTVAPYSPRAFWIDTDNRSGGCTQRFRLKRIPPCAPRTTCLPGECGQLSNGCGGSINCGTCGGGGGGGCLQAGAVRAISDGSNVLPPICRQATKPLGPGDGR
jgi:hypothetical protein